MIHSKKILDCTQYQQIVYKFLKLVELDLEPQSLSTTVITIPFDFLTQLNIVNKTTSDGTPTPSGDSKSSPSKQPQLNLVPGEDHLNQIISTIVMTIKQVLYARATDIQAGQ